MKASRVITTALCSAFLTMNIWAQGSLTPPGAPAPTMKTLDQIEARTPISTLPFSIRNPGSYYVTADLTGVAARDGIVIDSDDVTVDLNGFTLRGVPGSRNGILVLGNNSQISVNNGTVRDWGINGIDGGTTTHSRFSNLQLADNNFAGLQVSDYCLVEHCQASGNGGAGISIKDAGQIRHCASEGNSSEGIIADSYSQVIESICTGNVTGLVVGANSTVSHCRADNNLVHGMVAGTGSLMQSSSASLNSQLGIAALGDCSVVDCTLVSNGTDGILVASACVVKNNSCKSNGSTFFGAGIRISGDRNRIEGNHLTQADRGLWITGTDNYVADNTVMDNTENYVIAAGNHLNLLLSEIPETIEWPARVLLAGTLTGVSGQNGLTINSDNVTLEMNGHTLIGVPGSLSGILVQNSTPDHRNITIRNGGLSDWGAHGLNAEFCDNSSIRNVQAVDNASHGIYVNDEWIVQNCQTSANGGIGIFASDNCTISDCVASFNASNGVKVVSVSTVRDCVVQKNGGSGIRVQNDNRIIGNTVDDNDRDGIRITSGDTRVDSNHVTDNDWRGIAATSAGALIIRNTAAGNDTNYYFAANNRYGPIVDVDTVNGDISGTANSDHPWANFEF